MTRALSIPPDATARMLMLVSEHKRSERALTAAKPETADAAAAPDRVLPEIDDNLEEASKRPS